MSSILLTFVASALGVCTVQQPQEDPKKAEADEAVKKFRAEYTGKGATTEAQAMSVKILTSVIHRRTLAEAGRLLFPSEPEPVSIAAADAVGAFREIKGASSYLTGAYNSNAKRPEVRKAILRGLGALRAGETLSMLHGLAEGKPYDIAKEAIDSIGKVGKKLSIPVLIAFLKKVEVDPAKAGTGGAETGNPIDLPSVPNGPAVPKVGPGGGIGPNVPAGGYGAGVSDGDARREQDERRRMLQSPINGALGLMTGEKYTTSKEWELWWQRKGSTYQEK
jgi:hypothetical protein